ncbi:hypothetical protein FRC12_021078 [Ceratobasidium sp. 428]|nr:hypothetical protein FRC12_021078 [Ceratobasidium sp. 428]
MTALACKRDPRNILGIPELFAMVAKFCDKSDLARLSSVCSATFYGATPLVWKHVEGIHNILSLLPGIRVIKQGRKSRVTLTISTRVACAPELARLRLYLASIRVIKIHNRVVSHYDVTSWQVLVDGLESQTLPLNVQSLDLTSTCSDCAKYQLLWVKAFACNSLTTVFSIPPSLSANPEMSTLYLNGLVDLLAKKSPHIEKLSLFSRSDAPDTQVSIETPLISLACSAPSFESSLTALSKLQNLDCNSGVLYGGLASIGSLPQLRSLTVWPSHSALIYDTQESNLSSASFPMLNQLILRSTAPYEVEGPLKMTLMLRQITVLRIFLDQYDWITENSWVISGVFARLRNAPLLQDLYIQLLPGFEHTCILCTIGYQTLMDVTRVLPLRTIVLDNIYFENSEIASPFRGIQAIWSQVTYLSLPNQLVRSSDLAHIATLPNLQYLLLTLLLSNKFPAEDSLETSGGMMLRTLNGSTRSRMRGCVVSQLATFLRRLWPNLLGVTWLAVDRTAKDELEQLNQEIRKLGNSH